MAKTITISLPDELHEAVQGYKSRFNVSQICQEALMAKIEHLRMVESEDYLEFLRGSKKEHGEKYAEMGTEHARDAIKNKKIDYPTFLAIESLCGAIEYENAWSELKNALRDAENGTLFDELSEAAENCRRDDRAFDENAFAVGFINSACQLWEEIKDKI